MPVAVKRPLRSRAASASDASGVQPHTASDLVAGVFTRRGYGCAFPFPIGELPTSMRGEPSVGGGAMRVSGQESGLPLKGTAGLPMMQVEDQRIRNAGRSIHADRDVGKSRLRRPITMAMIINTNVAALNAQRNLSNTSSTMGKTLEKLSSGLRINRAADDAAGLAISEKMRAQVRGMQQGQRNAQDGVSMLQTAEGALNEVHTILQRVRELSVQAGNSTLSSSDRTAIGEEMVALRSEIDNIASRTRFNGLNLLNGSLAVTHDDGTATLDTDTVTENGATVSVASIDVGNADASATYTLADGGGGVLSASVTSGGFTRSETFTVQDMGANGTQDVTFEELGVSFQLSHDANAGNVTGAAIATGLAGSTVVTTASSSASFRVGSEVGDDITLSFTDMRSSALGNASKLSTLVADNSAVSTTAKADTLLASVDEAIGQVSTFRAVLGARQNQLETAINSIGVSVENLSASESRIRDADIASVSSQMMTSQIMQQAGVSVLAQANAAPQSVLSLIG